VSSPNCSPIIALHGLYTSKEYFYDLAANLAKQLQRPYFALDMRSHGESPHRAFDGKASLMVLAQDVTNFMDEFSIGKALLIGHGLGGRAMVQLAQMNEARVDKVITVDLSQDGPYVFSKSFPKYLYYLNEIDTSSSNSSLSYARLVMKEILRSHVKNPITLRYVLENIRLDAEGKYKWRFNVRVLEQLLANWSQVKQINYSHQSKDKLLNIVTKHNYITSEDYLDLKKAFTECQVDHISSRYMLANKPSLIKAIEKFAVS